MSVLPALRPALPNPDFAAARRAMIEGQIRPSNVVNPSLMDALARTPRENFVPLDYQALSYSDREIPLGRNRFLLDPVVQARLLEEADIRRDDHVLDVGCGTGYSSVLLAQLTHSGIALESDPDLAKHARHNLNETGADHFQVKTGDLARGWPRHSPYSLIILNGMVSDIPSVLLKQLNEGGRLMAIQQRDGLGRAVQIVRTRDHFTTRVLFDANASWLDGFEPRASFRF